MFTRRKIPEDHPAFRDLPVVPVTLGRAREYAAVHISGTLARGKVPLVCVAGYERNMSDFKGLLSRSHPDFIDDHPIVLIDLQGRGRSSDRAAASQYGTPNDAADVAQVIMALGIERAVFVGQGYGGQALMLLARDHPLLVAGLILSDAGPLSDPRGLVRLRTNLEILNSLKGRSNVLSAFHRILGRDYPGADEQDLETLAMRSHYIDKRGRARPLFDARFESFLKQFSLDDVLAAQWPIYDALRHVPLFLIRTQFTNQLRRETFEEMVHRRPDARAMVIKGQGSPALLDEPSEIAALAEFVRHAATSRLELIS
ncbi:alpha/beta hydrolase [Devosia pacifica]|uniref:Alpha/beta hydrolase n=1 Tax=Devosia pacifica TaxID=1335967 RepID=A0A918SFM3_9HYPH|nr:alpha/beta hydrolase [Devosia pacifica]GHA36271.1 alpha/beta hydrolase [Devosia pacifica]